MNNNKVVKTKFNVQSDLLEVYSELLVGFDRMQSFGVSSTCGSGKYVMAATIATKFRHESLFLLSFKR